MKSFSEYWQRRLEDVETSRAYAAVQLGKCVASELLLKGFEQMAIPIEEAMEEENEEMLANPEGDDAA